MPTYTVLAFDPDSRRGHTAVVTAGTPPCGG